MNYQVLRTVPTTYLYLYDSRRYGAVMPALHKFVANGTSQRGALVIVQGLSVLTRRCSHLPLWGTAAQD